MAVHQSWNAVGCCSYAGAHNVNDLAFLKALVVRLDPRHARRIYLPSEDSSAPRQYMTDAEADAERVKTRAAMDSACAGGTGN